MDDKDIIEKLEKIDWEFESDDTRFATHGIHRYSSKYIPQIPETLINLTTNIGDVVLDPFIGSGTTLLEANRLGRNSIGVDMGPVAYLITKTKLTPIPLDRLDIAIRDFIDNVSPRTALARAAHLKLSQNQSLTLSGVHLPNFEYAENWYQKNVLTELTIIKDYINTLSDLELKMFFVCAFSAIVRAVSNASSGYGNLMIDKNKRKISNTFEIYQNQLLRMRTGMEEFNKIFNKNYPPKIYQGDATNLHFVSSKSIDSIITHPPYISAVPYAEYLRLSLLWLQDSFRDIFEKKFWEYLNYKKLDESIVGGKRHKKDVVERFHNSMQLAFAEMYRVLKPHKYCCVVIGNPVVRGQQIKCDQMFLDIAKNIGFKSELNIRRGKYKTTMGKMKEEFILVFRK